MIEFIYNRNNNDSGLVGIEIGTYQGDNAFSILSVLPMRKLFLVDPYLECEDYNDRWMGNRSQAKFNENFEIAKAKLKRFDNKMEFVRKTSEEAVGDIPNNLDFVYIDGNHDYDYVKQDIELYYPKVKDGGILGGHNFESCYPGVARAVLEFVNEMGLELHGKVLQVDWWMAKGKEVEDK